MKITVKIDQNMIVVEDISVYFKELLELIDVMSKSIKK